MFFNTQYCHVETKFIFTGGSITETISSSWRHAFFGFVSMERPGQIVNARTQLSVLNADSQV